MKLRHFVFAACASALTFAACEQVTDPAAPDKVPEIYTVKLDCTGEIEVNQAPLTRYTPDKDDLYGVQVYYKPVSGSNSYKKYAYGLFDDLSNVTIDLIADYKFRFCVDVVVDGKTNVYSDGIQIDSVNYVGYGYPFQANNNYSGTIASTITKVSDEFTYSEECYFLNLGSSFQRPGQKGQIYFCPEGVEAYYGVTEIVPTSDGQTVSIFLKRMVFGLKVVADDFLKEGEVEVSVYSNSNYNRIDYDYVLTPENKSLEHTYAYNSRSSWYDYEELADAYSNITIDFAWTKDDGTVLKLNSKSIKINRLKQTIVNVTFYEDTSIEDAKLSAQFEDQVFVEEGQPIYSFGENQSDYEF